MARIQTVDQPSAKSQELLEGVKKKLGSTPNIFTTFAHSPAILDFYLSGSAALGESSISAGLREQIALTVAGANGCDYCSSAHTAIGKMVGLDEEELNKNLHGKASDEKVQAALGFVLTLVEHRAQVSDAEVQRLKLVGYSEAEILEIVTVTAFNIFTNYFNHVADTDVDFPLVSTQEVSKVSKAS